jgi:hypothetical protein
VYHVTIQNTVHQTSPATPKNIHEQEASRKKYKDITTNLSTMHTQLKTKILSHLGLPQKTKKLQKQLQHNTSPPPSKTITFYVYVFICVYIFALLIYSLYIHPQHQNLRQ